MCIYDSNKNGYFFCYMKEPVSYLAENWNKASCPKIKRKKQFCVYICVQILQLALLMKSRLVCSVRNFFFPRFSESVCFVFEINGVVPPIACRSTGHGGKKIQGTPCLEFDTKASSSFYILCLFLFVNCRNSLWEHFQVAFFLFFLYWGLHSNIDDSKSKQGSQTI